MKIESYKLTKQVNSIVLMCSEKREFEACGYNYTEHSLDGHKRILENTSNGRCIEFNVDKDSVTTALTNRSWYFDFDDRPDNTIYINTDVETLVFNAKLTRRKNRVLTRIKLKIRKILRMYLCW